MYENVLAAVNSPRDCYGSPDGAVNRYNVISIAAMYVDKGMGFQTFFIS